jgi:hypothetical protein
MSAMKADWDVTATIPTGSRVEYGLRFEEAETVISSFPVLCETGPRRPNDLLDGLRCFLANSGNAG